MKTADISVCNLDCVVAWGGKHVLKPYTFKARPACLPVLQKYFSAVCVANNHAGDYGPEGLAEELNLLEKAGLPFFGGGRDRKEAYRPLVLERKGRPIIYSLGNFVFDYFPGDPLVWSGWVVRLTFAKAAPPELEIFVVELDRSGIPHLVPKTKVLETKRPKG